MERMELIAALDQDERRMLPLVGPARREKTRACRTLLGVWLRALNVIGLMLVDSIVAMRPQPVEAAPSNELASAWLLLRRARRWLDALTRRLAANPHRLQQMQRVQACLSSQDGASQDGASQDGASQVGASKDGPSEAGEPDAEPDSRPARRTSPQEQLGRKTALQLVEHICADLAEAAVLLGNGKTARIVIEIAKAARALLTGPVEDVLKAWSDGLAEFEPETAALLAMAAPDTG